MKNENILHSLPKRILMLGWEFPPVQSGGLGVASKSLAQAVQKLDNEVTFLIPAFIGKQLPAGKKTSESVNVEFFEGEEDFSYIKIPSLLFSPYQTQTAYTAVRKRFGKKEIYGANLFEEIARFVEEGKKIEFSQKFDVIHAHDWISFELGMELKKKMGLPLVLHVHATEHDRTAGNPYMEIFDREKKGLDAADKIVAVSFYTKKILQEIYDIPEEKIAVVHNGRETTECFGGNCKRKNEKKVVLFLGRLTIQKGVEWFLSLSEKILQKRKDVQFLIGGTGEMLPSVIEKIIEKNLQDDIIPLGFLNTEERNKIFEKTDVFVMPSVSEPFGLVAIEAAERGCAVVMSTQSGAREVLANSFHSNFWETDKMAGQILGLLDYPKLKNLMVKKSQEEIEHLTWEHQAEKMNAVYEEVVVKK